MYKIKANDNLIYDARLDEIQMISVSLINTANVADNFTFKPSPKNTLVNNLKKYNTYIEVLEDDSLIFRGRIFDDKADIFGVKTFQCEGELAFFCDTVVRPYSWDSGGVQDYLQFLIDNHNSQVDDNKKFVLRDVTVIDPNNYIVRASSDYPNTYNEIKTKLLDLLGGFLLLERIGNITYIDYLIDSPYISNQPVKLGKNILDLLLSSKGKDIYTAVIPLGAKTQDASGNDTGRLTIKDVNNGIDYLYDEEAVEEYGFRVKTVIHDDVTIASNLKAKGLQDLASCINPILSLEVKVIDLKNQGANIDAIKFLNYVEIESNGIDGKLLVVKKTTDLLNAGNNTITIGSEYGSFTKKNVELNQKITKIENDYIGKQVISDVNNTIVNLWTSLTQTENNILSQVESQYITKNQYGVDISNINTELEQTNNSFDFRFNQVNKNITSVDNATQTKFDEISNFIRFVDGNIILGEAGNQLTLSLENDIIYFSQSGVKVAYISNNKLYILNGEFLKILIIGNFAFIPRNNGNLSFRKIKQNEVITNG